MNERLGARVRELRVQAGLTQVELGRMVALSRPSITNIEQGRQPVTVELLLDLADALGVPPTSLLPPIENETSPSLEMYTSELSEDETRWVYQIIGSGRHEQPA